MPDVALNEFECFVSKDGTKAVLKIHPKGREPFTLTMTPEQLDGTIETLKAAAEFGRSARKPRQ